MIINSQLYLRWILAVLLMFGLSAVNGQDLTNIKNKPPLALSGNLSFQTDFYNASGVPDRRKPFQYILSGNPTLDIYGIAVPFNFILSNITSSFGHPFNQFGISPNYKWIKLYLGYQNVAFSPYTMGGRRMLGAGFDLTPGKWRFGFFYGRLQKAFNTDSVVYGIVPGTAVQISPQYTRMGWSALVRRGDKQKSYVEVSLFQGKDIASSLPYDTTRTLPTPEANSAISLGFGLALSKHLFWETEGALSAYTRDTRATELDNSDEWYTKPVSFFYVPRQSSQYLTAFHSALKLKYKRFGTSIELKRIDPDYKSMGAVYISSDLQSVSLSANWRSKKGKFSTRLTGGIQQDNVTHSKANTSQRIIGRGSINWQISGSLGLSATYSNYGLTRNGAYTLGVDTFGVRQVNKNFSLSPHYSWHSDSKMQVLTGVFNLQDMSNTQESISLEQHTHSLVAGLSHSLTLQQKGLTFSTNLTRTSQTGDLISASSWTITESVAQAYKDKPVSRVGANLSFSTNAYNGSGNGFTIYGGLNAGFKFTKTLPASLQFNITRHQANSQTEAAAANTYSSYYLNSFTEFRLSIRFSFDLSALKLNPTP